MPLDLAKPFSLLAAEEDDVSVVRARIISRRLETEAETAGYNLEEYFEAQKTNAALVPKSSAATRERAVKAFAAEKRKLATFLANLRAEKTSRSAQAAQKTAETVQSAEAYTAEAGHRNVDVHIQRKKNKASPRVLCMQHTTQQGPQPPKKVSKLSWPQEL